MAGEWVGSLSAPPPTAGAPAPLTQVLEHAWAANLTVFSVKQ
jgi:hypothetical protein